MDFLTILLWIITGTCLIISLFKDKRKTTNALKSAITMMKGIAGQIIAILFLIGIIITFFPPELIKNYINSSNTILATIISAIIGSITLIPAFVAFPLIGSFIDVGINIIPSVAFLTTLTMVGIVTFPLEKREFGTKFALTRNIFSFIFAITIALLMGGLI